MASRIKEVSSSSFTQSGIIEQEQGESHFHSMHTKFLVPDHEDQ